jgi:diguanylate cyclase (GGDEF)-like protein/PAS domain S-box-containing protein
MSGRRSAWWLYLTIATVGAVAYYATPKGTPRDVEYLAIGFSSVVAILVGVRLHRPERRGPWLLFALGLSLFVLGDVTFDAPSMFGRDLIASHGPDVLHLLAYPVLAAGMAALVRSHVRTALTGAIDGAIIALGVGVLTWVFVMAPYARDQTLTATDKTIAIAYPALDLVVLAVLLRLVASRWVRNPAFGLLAASVSILLATDATYAVILAHYTYTARSLIDLGWIASYALWGAAALHPSMSAVRATGTVEPSRRRALIVTLTFAALAAPAMLFVQDLRGDRAEVALLAATSAITFLLVVARMGIVARALAEARLQRARDDHMFRSLIQKSSDVVTLASPDHVLRYASEASRTMFGADPAELVGRSFDTMIHPDDAARVFAMFGQVVAADLRASATIEFRVRHADGNWRVVEAIVTNRLDDPDVDAVVVNLRDVTERRALEARLLHQTFYDDLTGLANRALFLDRVQNALQRHDRDIREIAVLFLDLDDFKTVNDSLGHPAGDRLLVEVARRLELAIRPGDTLARFGGDEFALLLEAGEMPGVAEAVARRIVAGLGTPFCVGEDNLSIRASIGIAVGHAFEDSSEDLLRDADLAMFLAKHNGKGRYEIYRPAMHDEAVNRLRLAAELRHGIEAHEFEVFYQPTIHTETRAIAGAEALVRWRHPMRGLVSPIEFIPAAEATGLIVALGNQVLVDACRQAQSWRRSGAVDDNFYISVNLSARQLNDPAIVDDVAQALTDSGLEPADLVLEVTESAIMEDREKAIERLKTLKAFGLRVAIDDFGTGYSSLSYLATLPADIVKIDKSFIDHIVHDPDGAAMVRSIIELTRTLGLTTIAEGVETEEQRTILARLGCEAVQGHLFSEAIDHTEMSAALAAHPHGAPWRPVPASVSAR